MNQNLEEALIIIALILLNGIVPLVAFSWIITPQNVQQLYLSG